MQKRGESEALAREAVRAFYWRTLRQRFGWTGALAFVVALAALAFLVLAGDRSWFVGFVGACLLFVVLILAFGYIAHHRNATHRFRRMTNPEARFVFTERDFSITVAVGTGIAPRPPHRSRRALLTHRAPPSGFGVETVTGQRV